MTSAEGAAWLARPWHRAPRVATRHFARDRGSSSALNRALSRITSRGIARDIAISRFVADSIGTPSVLIPNGVPDRPQAPLESPAVLMLQRLDSEKAPEVGIRAWSASGLDHHGWRLLVAGNGGLRGSLAQLARDLGSGDSVDFLGQVTATDDLLARASILLAPAPEEPFGLSVVEAMAHGIPVVAARGGGHLETVADSGVLFTSDDPKGAGEALAELGASRPMRLRMGQDLRRRQREMYSLSDPRRSARGSLRRPRGGHRGLTPAGLVAHAAPGAVAWRTGGRRRALRLPIRSADGPTMVESTHPEAEGSRPDTLPPTGQAPPTRAAPSWPIPSLSSEPVLPGLTAAYQLVQRGDPVVVVEADDVVGGVQSRTVERDGWRFDIGGHRFFTKVKPVEDLWHEILPPEDFLVRPRMSRIFYEGKYYDYPLRAGNALKNLGLWESFLCGMSYLRSRVRPPRDQSNYEGWLVARFGWRLYRTFFKTYTEKVWGVPVNEMPSDWAAQRIKNLDLGKAVLNALTPKRNQQQITSLIEEFQYPRRFGPGMMWERCRDLVEGRGGTVLMGDRSRLRQRQRGSRHRRHRS